MTPKVSIIVITHNQYEKSGVCFKSIHSRCQVPYELIWVDNGSEKGNVKEMQKHAVVKGKNVKSIKLGKNLGFIKAVNQAIPQIDPASEYVVLLNNDTEIGPQAIDKMIKPLQHKEIGAVGCLTQSKISWQEPLNLNKIFKALPVKLPAYTGSVLGYSGVIDRKFRNKYLDVSNCNLAFFAVAFRREVFVDVLHGLEECFGVGLGEDDYACHKLRFLGYKILVALDAFVYHHHRTTFKALKLSVDQIRRKNVSTLRNKVNELKK